MNFPEPNFIARDPQVITTEIVAQYEKLTGKTLYPAQAERILIDILAYRETLVRIGIQEAAKQNLVAFARAPMIDYLGELVGVTRLAAKPANTTHRFLLLAPLATNLLIPAGTRIDGGDGNVVFATDADVTLPAGQLALNVTTTCTEPGVLGNGWEPGQINHLLDDLGDMDIQVANIAKTANGVEEEETERLRERIKLAPESFSTAGSRLAYRFHALAAHQSILDVAVLSPVPGAIDLYPLLYTGLPDANLLSLVEAKCSGERVRPLNDQVRALAPIQVDYAIVAQLELYDTAIEKDVLIQVQAKAAAYRDERAAGFGRDLVPSQVSKILSVPGVYDVTILAPVLKVLAANEWAHCTGITLTVKGTVDG